MSICKSVLIKELKDQVHPEKVEDVIFWALDFYAKNKIQKLSNGYYRYY